ncbi:MAG: S8 family peptidase [Rhizobacter sp.]
MAVRALLTALLMASAALAHAQQATAVLGLIVKFKNAVPHEQMAAATEQPARVAEDDRMRQVLRVARMSEVRMRPVGRAAQHLDFGRVLSPAEAAQLAAQLRAQPDVEWVVPNERERRLDVVPNDPMYLAGSGTTGQWWLHPVSAALPNNQGVPGIQTAWATEKGNASAVVAVLDTGVAAHSELGGRLLPGYDFVSEVKYANDGGGRDTDPSDPGDWVDDNDLNDPLFAGCMAQDSSWHGTVISGILAAATNNNIGIAGVNWNGRVLPVRVAGKCGASVADIIDGMRWAAGLAVPNATPNANPARVINISFGGSAACTQPYQEAIDELATHGVVVVAAAGNEMTSPTRPASCNGVIGVAALGRDGLKASYSNFGSKIVVSTVGGDPARDDGLLTLSNLGTQQPLGESYDRAYGTSFASPVVAGIVSLMLSANAKLTASQIVSGLQSTARPHVAPSGVLACSTSHPGSCACTTSTCGAGIADADRAVQFALKAPDLSGGSSSSGGGALSWPWLVGLALGVWALSRSSGLARTRRERPAQ